MTPYEKYMLFLVSAILLVMVIMLWSAYNAYAELYSKLNIFVGTAQNLAQQAPELMVPLKTALENVSKQEPDFMAKLKAVYNKIMGN